MRHYFETKSADGQVNLMPHSLFEDLYIPDIVSDCWLWIGTTDKDGYGRYKGDRAHRESYRRFNGEIGQLYVLHKCDNPSCVNPEHLFLGTQLDNIADMVNKRRHASLNEKNFHAKLTVAQVDAIRVDTRVQKTIARDYGISQQQVSGIKTGRYWK